MLGVDYMRETGLLLAKHPKNEPGLKVVFVFIMWRKNVCGP